MSPCRQILLSFDKPPQCQANLPSLACHSPLAKSICEVNLATQQGQVNKSMSTWHVDIAKPTLHNTSRYQISYQRSWVHYIMQKFNHPIFVSNIAQHSQCLSLCKILTTPSLFCQLLSTANGKLTRAHVNTVTLATNMLFTVTNLGSTLYQSSWDNRELVKASKVICWSHVALRKFQGNRQ